MDTEFAHLPRPKTRMVRSNMLETGRPTSGEEVTGHHGQGHHTCGQAPIQQLSNSVSRILNFNRVPQGTVHRYVLIFSMPDQQEPEVCPSRVLIYDEDTPP
jgi:hypothetical protein